MKKYSETVNHVAQKIADSCFKDYPNDNVEVDRVTVAAIAFAYGKKVNWVKSDINKKAKKMFCYLEDCQKKSDKSFEDRMARDV